MFLLVFLASNFSALTIFLQILFVVLTSLPPFHFYLSTFTPLLGFASFSLPWQCYWCVGVTPTSYVPPCYHSPVENLIMSSRLVRSSLILSSYVFHILGPVVGSISINLHPRRPVDDNWLHVCVHFYHFFFCRRIFSPGSIHGAQQFLPTSPNLTPSRSAIYYMVLWEYPPQFPAVIMRVTPVHTP